MALLLAIGLTHLLGIAGPSGRDNPLLGYCGEQKCCIFLALTPKWLLLPVEIAVWAKIDHYPY
jgi:hypothetical protein